jgi:hypothetical protein
MKRTCPSGGRRTPIDITAAFGEGGVYLDACQPWEVAYHAAKRGDVDALLRARETAVEALAEMRRLIRVIDQVTAQAPAAPAVAA